MNLPLAAWVNIPSNNEDFEAYFDIYVYAGSTQEKRVIVFFEDIIASHDQWMQITKDIPVTAGTTRVEIQICVREMAESAASAPDGYTKDGVWSGEISIDNISLVGPN